MLEETIGECIGLERAAQKAVQELDAKGLLPEQMKSKLTDMQQEASKHEDVLQTLADKLTESEELDSKSIEEHADETVEKVSQMMKTYLGEDADELDALEFLSIAEGGEMIHYEILNKVIDKAKHKGLAKNASDILQQEKRHFKMCVQLAKSASMHT